MGTLSEHKLLVQVSLPIMISMTIQGLYNVIDSVFVAKINQDALNAVSLAFPIQNLMISMAVGISIGMNALLARRLGEKDPAKANQTALNGLLLTLIGSILFLLLGLLGTVPYFSSQTETPRILAYGQEYMWLICVFAFPTFFGITYERLLQATGRTVLSMTSQAAGAVVNIILDPILIFGLLGCPRLEVRGAAIATIIGQSTTMLLNMWFHYRHNTELTFRFKGFRPDGGILRDVSAVAIPSMAMGSVTSVLVFGLNQILMVYSATAVAVLGIYYKLQSFIFMAVFGLNNGMVPIISYNFGARSYPRVMKTFSLGLRYGMALTTFGMVLFLGWSEDLILMFQGKDATAELMEIGVPALRILSLTFPLAGFSMVTSSMFQAFGHGMMGLIGATLRQLVILLPCAYIFGKIWGLQSIWYAFFVGEAAAMLYFMACAVKVYRQDILPLKQTTTE